MILVGRGLVPRRNVHSAGDKPPPYISGLTASDRRYQARDGARSPGLPAMPQHIQYY